MKLVQAGSGAPKENLSLLPPLWSHYTGHTALAGTSCQELEGFVGAKFTAHVPLLTARKSLEITKRTVVSGLMSLVSVNRPCHGTAGNSKHGLQPDKITRWT